jgi:glycosyltransferase involved in cell wall biosynthesis
LKPRNEQFLSLVFPAYNEESNLRALYDEVSNAVKAAEIDCEMVFVDNGSSDGSLALIKSLSSQDSRVRYVSLSRNFGHQAGLFAGMSHSRGDAVITMDADLQHPPSLIPEMVRKWREGFDVVYTTKAKHHVGVIKGLQIRMFYWGLGKLSGLKLSFGQSDYRLLDRRVLDALLSIEEYRKFLRGTVEWMGFRQTGIEFVVIPRRAGESKFSYWALVSFALDGILGFSSQPLRWFAAAGAMVAGLCGLYGIYVLALVAVNLGDSSVVIPPGWASLAVAVAFLGGVQLLGIGVLGEYISRVYDQTKGRPVFLVRETSEDGIDDQA